jgi:3-oxoacyl-[acyl-carrier-protein] synthase III
VLVGSDDPTAEDGVLYTRSGTEGSDPSLFHREAGGSTMPFNEETFRQGLHHWRHDFAEMVARGRPYCLEIARRVQTATAIDIAEVDYIVPAAANFNYFKEKEKNQRPLSPEEDAFLEKVRARTFTNFSEVGNIPSAAIYTALNQLYEEGKFKRGTLLLLPSVEGATWGWGASLVRWHGAGNGKA